MGRYTEPDPENTTVLISISCFTESFGNASDNIPEPSKPPASPEGYIGKLEAWSSSLLCSDELSLCALSLSTSP
jgi:hypothetical protein